jgi:hypothetical protein
LQLAEAFRKEQERLVLEELLKKGPKKNLGHTHGRKVKVDCGKNSNG